MLTCDEHLAELVEQCQQLGPSDVLVVHYLLQMMLTIEVRAESATKSCVRFMNEIFFGNSSILLIDRGVDFCRKPKASTGLGIGNKMHQIGKVLALQRYRNDSLDFLRKDTPNFSRG